MCLEVQSPRSDASGPRRTTADRCRDGRVEETFLTKVIGPGTSLERVRVGSHPAFWIEGDPHAFFYRNDRDGILVDERRWVGDALIWSDGTITYRIESALGRDASIALAESLE